MTLKYVIAIQGPSLVIFQPLGLPSHGC